MSYSVKNITISPKLLEKAVKTSQEKLYFFYCHLKSKQTSGTFKNLHSDIQSISKELKISEQTVRRLINSLVREGFAYWTSPNGKQMKSKGHFKLIAMRKVGHYLGEYKSISRTQKVSLKSKYSNCKEVFLTWCLENQRAKQIFKIKDNLVTITSNKKLKDTLKRMSEEDLKAYLSEKNLCGSEDLLKLGLSRMSIADIKGLKSASSGSRWVKRLIHAKLIKGEVKRTKYHGSYNPLKLRELIKEFGNKFYVFNGNIYERDINEIIFKDKKLNSITGKKKAEVKKNYKLTAEQSNKAYGSLKNIILE